MDRKITMRLKTKEIKGDNVKNIKMRLASRAIFHMWLGGRGGCQGGESVGGHNRTVTFFVRVSRSILTGIRNFG
jgi:hypothetical protein